MIVTVKEQTSLPGMSPKAGVSDAVMLRISAPKTEGLAIELAVQLAAEIGRARYSEIVTMIERPRMLSIFAILS